MIVTFNVFYYMTQEETQSTAQDFYQEALQLLLKHQSPVLIGGAFALYHYTGIYRDTKDLDLFCKAEDYPSILKLLSQHGYRVEVTDPRWLAKAYKGDYFIDLIFNTTNHTCFVDDSWFEKEEKGELFEVPVRFILAEELLWTKIYVQNRERYDGADINHLILRYGSQLDWQKLWNRMKQHWNLLLSQLLNFQFIYPSDRKLVPSWLFDELLALAKSQYELPEPIEKVCLGPLVDHTQYQIDITEWKYKSFTTKTL